MTSREAGQPGLLFEDLRGSKFDAQFRNFEQSSLRQAGIAGMEPAGVGIDQPDMPDAPIAVFLQFGANGGMAIIGREDFDGDERRRIGNRRFGSPRVEHRNVGN